MFDQITDTIDMINQAGLHPGWILLAGLLFAISFMLAIRELVSWFFKIDSLKEQLTRVEKKIDFLQSQSLKVQTALEPTTKKPTEEKQNFPLHH